MIEGQTRFWVQKGNEGWTLSAGGRGRARERCKEGTIGMDRGAREQKKGIRREGLYVHGRGETGGKRVKEKGNKDDEEGGSQGGKRG